MVPYLTPRLAHLQRAIRVSSALDKLGNNEKIAQAKVALDEDIFDTLVRTADPHVKIAESNPVGHAATALATTTVSLYSLVKMAQHQSVSVRDKRLVEAVDKLAAIGAIEGTLNLLPANLSGETRKLATEIRVLNRAYGVRVLNELLK